MTIIAKLLTRMIFMRFAVILFGLSAFALTLEVVGFLNDIARINSNAFLAVATYLTMRFPGELVLFLPTSFLLALLLAMTELSYRNELTAIWATGISPTRLIIRLLPLALGIGFLHFALMEFAVPAAAPALRQWGIGDYATRKLTTKTNEPTWIRSGTDLMRADSISEDGSTLFNLTIFRREASGQLAGQVFADKATQSDGQWQLSNVTSYSSKGEPPKRLSEMTYDGPLRIANSQVASPEEMSLRELSSFINNGGFGVRPAHVYQTWRQKRLSPALIAIVVLTLCVPLGTTFRRGGGLGKIFVAGVILGFAYFVGDGIATTLGENGEIAPWLAAWGPIALFAAIALGALARTDHV